MLTTPTSFIIETCHEADAHARHASRAKIKVDDFQFCLRHDSKKLGRVQELLDMDREIKAKRKAFNVDEGKITKEVSAEGGGKRKKNNNAAAAAAEEEEGGDKEKKGAVVGGGAVAAAGDGEEGVVRSAEGEVGIKREDSGSVG
jgi:transcription initiation factor TFIID subunit 13